MFGFYKNILKKEFQKKRQKPEIQFDIIKGEFHTGTIQASLVTNFSKISKLSFSLNDLILTPLLDGKDENT